MRATRTKALLVGLLIGCLPAGVAQAQSVGGDPMEGTWVLNLARSTYSPGPAPRSTIWTYQNRADGFTAWTAISVNAAGVPGFSFALRKYDGREYPVFDATNLPAFINGGTRPTRIQKSRLIDARTTEVVNIVDGMVMTTVTRTLAPDGKTLTSRTVGKNAAGQPISDMTVWDRQDPAPPTSAMR